MPRFLFLALAIHLSCGTTLVAEEYLVRVEKIGYVDQPEPGKKPQEAVLNSIEVIASPNAAFHSNVKIGMETLEFAGKFQPAEKGDFQFQYQYRHLIDTGETVPTFDGKGQAIIDETKIESTVTILVGKPTLLGGMDVVNHRSDKTKLKSKSRYVLVVSKYQPDPTRQTTLKCHVKHSSNRR